MKINERGYWEEVCKHHTDDGLRKALVDLVENLKSIADFGCGDGSYVKAILQKYPNKTVKAFDGNPNVESITGGVGSRLDLSTSFNLDMLFDLVISLEVSEHIPVEYEKVFIQNLIKHTSKYLLISWAIPGQGGKGHVNERSNEYVLNVFQAQGFNHLIEHSQLLRNSITNCNWFKNTLFLFEKK